MSTAQQVTNQGTVSTTDATPTIAVQLDMPQDSMGNFEVNVIARRPSNNDTKSWRSVFSSKRTGSGNATIVGALQNVITPIEDLGALLWSFSLTASGMTLSVKVIGAAGVSIDWFAEFNGELLY